MTKTMMMSAVLVMMAAGCAVQPVKHGDPGSQVDGGIESDAADEPGSGSGSDPGSDTGSGEQNVCTPREVTCDGDNQKTCNASGTGEDGLQCQFGCDPDHGCNVCEPNTLTCSDANTLQTCGADGLPVSREVCESGCDPTGVAHCAHIEPHYLPDACDASSTVGGLLVTQAKTIDTGTDCDEIVPQVGGPAICVVHVQSVTIASAGILHASGPNALALVADNDIVVGGQFDVTANGITPGPGGGLTASGGNGSFTIGSGGAGFHTFGGNGGTVTVSGGAANRGSPVPNPANGPLVGGPNGGGVVAARGGGGGAATLIACRGTVEVTGILSAGGGGGINTGGGGAGGYIVVQGVGVKVTGQVFANGGGGGATLAQGANGAAVLFAAAGGASKNGAGPGGTGAVGLTGLGGGGQKPSSSTRSPGSGGGGLGFFQAYASTASKTVVAPSVASPAFEPNLLVGLE